MTILSDLNVALENYQDVEALATDIYGLSALRQNLSGSGSSLPGSPIESALARKARLLRPYADLAEIAWDWGWDGSGNPVQYMIDRHDQILLTRGAIPVEHRTAIARAATLIERNVERFETTECPLDFDQARRSGDTWWCPTCDISRTEEEINDLRRFRIVQANPALTVRQIADLTGVPLGTLHQRIQRGGIRAAGRQGRTRTYHVADLM